jgi:hypothetical protein
MTSPSDPEPPDRRENSPASEPPPASLSQIVSAVLWSFFGVRKGKAMQRDVVTIKPHQVIIVGVLIAAGVVAGPLILVRLHPRGI